MSNLAIKHRSFLNDERIDHSDLLDFLIPISAQYPGIDQWLESKVIPGLSTGTRHVVRIVRDNQLAAIGIAKREGGESKICTVRVSAPYANRGIGVRVLKELIEWLGTDKPLATVSEDKLPEFSKIFDYLGFKLTSVQTGLYLPGKAEYFFNEKSEPRLIWSRK